MPQQVRPCAALCGYGVFGCAVWQAVIVEQDDRGAAVWIVCSCVPLSLPLCLGVADCAVGRQPVLIVPHNLSCRSLRLLLPAGGAGPPGAVGNRLLSLLQPTSGSAWQLLHQAAARWRPLLLLSAALPDAAIAASHPLFSALCPLMILLMLLSHTRWCQLAPPCSPTLPLTCTLDVCLWFAIVQNNTTSLLTWLGKCKRWLAAAAATEAPAQLCVHRLQLLLDTARHMSTSAAARRRRNAV